MTEPNRFPTVSVVIPCRNEVDMIEACLRSVMAQDLPQGDLEVIVVDGMSDDGTRDILSKLEREYVELVVLDNPDRTTPFAFNAGIRAAKGRYIALMGSHNRYAEDYLRQAIAVLEKTGADNVGGAMVCEGEGVVQRAISAAFHSPFSAGGARWHDPGYDGPADTVFGGVYRREVFEKIGLFDEELARNQDDEFNLRLLRAGGRIWQSTKIRSWYRPRASIKQLFRQYRQYGYWKVRVIQKHKIPASIRHLIPGAFVAFVALCVVSMLIAVALDALFKFPPAETAWAVSGMFLAVGILTYVATVLIGSLLTARVAGWNLLPLLVVVFPAYHFGYGIGFLEGVLDFVVLKRGARNSKQEMTR